MTRQARLVVGLGKPIPAVHHFEGERGDDDQRSERNQLRDQQMSIVGRTKRGDRPDLADRLKGAAERHRRDTGQRESGEPGHDPIEDHVRTSGGDDRDRQDNQTAEPDRGAADVDDVGDQREGDPPPIVACMTKVKLAISGPIATTASATTHTACGPSLVPRPESCSRTGAKKGIATTSGAGAQRGELSVA